MLRANGIPNSKVHTEIVAWYKYKQQNLLEEEAMQSQRLWVWVPPLPPFFPQFLTLPPSSLSSLPPTPLRAV